jgi:hypothetical protein
MRIAFTGAKNPRYGTKHPAAAKRKMREAWERLSPEVRALRLACLKPRRKRERLLAVA